MFHPNTRTFIYAQNNTMVVLLKTTSVWVSFIQIMQIRVEKKRKSIRKSRYTVEISEIRPWQPRQACRGSLGFILGAALT